MLDILKAGKSYHEMKNKAEDGVAWRRLNPRDLTCQQAEHQIGNTMLI